MADDRPSRPPPPVPPSRARLSSEICRRAPRHASGVGAREARWSSLPRDRRSQGCRSPLLQGTTCVVDLQAKRTGGPLPAHEDGGTVIGASNPAALSVGKPIQESP